MLMKVRLLIGYGMPGVWRWCLLALLMVSSLTGWRVAGQQGGQGEQTQPTLGPGVPNVGSSAPRSAAGTTKAGSVLFFQKYTSDASRQGEINSLLTLTNTNSRDSVNLRIFWVYDCGVEDRTLALMPNQTHTLLAGAEVPGRTGYMVAVAVNSQGVPTQFNWLIGSGRLRDVAGHEAAYNAFAVARRTAGAAVFSPLTGGWSLNFDGTEYDRLPKTVAIDRLQSHDPVTGVVMRTDIALFSPSKGLAIGEPEGVGLTATAYDAEGRGHVQSLDAGCYEEREATALWTREPFAEIISEGRPGWATFGARDGAGRAVPLLGLALADGLGQPLHATRVMQVVEWLDSWSIVFPSRYPGTPVTDVVTRDQPEAAGSEGAGETRPGSILLFPRFVSGKYGSSQIQVTNTNALKRVRLRAFFTGMADTPVVAGKFVTIEPRATATIEAGEVVPDQRGWAMIVAVDGSALPITFNHLIGGIQIREAGGLSRGFNALGIARNSLAPLVRNEDVSTVDLVFNGTDYDRLPATSAMSFVPSQSENATTIGFARAPGSMLDAPVTRGAGTVILFDSAINSYNTSMARTESRLSLLRQSNLTAPATSSLYPGENGWLRINTSAPLFSWALNQVSIPFSASGTTDGGEWKGGLNGDTNLHILTLAERHVIRVPAVNPNNRPPVAIAESIGLDVEARGPGGTIVRFDGSASYDDDADDELSYKWTDGGESIAGTRIADRRLAIGLHRIELKVSDASGVESPSGVQTVRVVDTTPPVITGVPTNLSRTTMSLFGETVAFPLPGAHDMVDGAVAVTASPASGSFFPSGTTTVTFTASDRFGNRATARMTVTLTTGYPMSQSGGEPGNRVPLMANLNDQYVRPGESRVVALQAADADNDNVSFRLVGAPSWAQIVSVDPVRRAAVMRLAPGPNETSGTTNTRIVIEDVRGGSFTTLPFRVMVSEQVSDETGGSEIANRSPLPRLSLPASPLKATGRDGAELLLDASLTSDPDGDAMTFVWYDGEREVGRGSIVRLVLAVGPHAIRVVVTDARGATAASDPLPIEILPRDLRIASVTPDRLDRGSFATISIIGAGFAPRSEVQLSKEGVTILGYNSIEEDRIELRIEVSATAPPSFRDVVVIIPGGRSTRLRSGLYVNP